MEKEATRYPREADLYFTEDAVILQFTPEDGSPLGERWAKRTKDADEAAQLFLAYQRGEDGEFTAASDPAYEGHQEQGSYLFHTWQAIIEEGENGAKLYRETLEQNKLGRDFLFNLRYYNEG